MKIIVKTLNNYRVEVELSENSIEWQEVTYGDMTHTAQLVDALVKTFPDYKIEKYEYTASKSLDDHGKTYVKLVRK